MSKNLALIQQAIESGDPELIALAQELAEDEGVDESILSKLGRASARTLKNLAVGAAETADLVATPVRGAMNLALSALGKKQIESLAPSIDKTIDTVTGGYTANKNKADEVMSEGVKAIGSFPMMGGLAKSAAMLSKPLLAKLLSPGKTAQALAVNTAMPMAGKKYEQENPDDLLGKILAEVGTGTLAGTTGAFLKAPLKTSKINIGNYLGEKLDIDKQSLDDFKKAGIDPLLSNISGNKVTKMLENQLAHHPFASDIIKEGRDNQRKSLLELFEQKSKGAPLEKEEASALAKKGRSEYLERQKRESNEHFKKVDEDLSKIDQKVDDFPQLRSFFEEVTKKVDFKDKDSVALFKKSPIGKYIFDLSKVGKDKELSIKPKSIKYLKQVLNDVNNKVTTFGLYGKQEQGELKKMAESLSKDMDETIGSRLKETVGTDSYNNWKEAKEHYKDFMSNDVTHINELLKKDIKSKEGLDSYLSLLASQKKGSQKTRIVYEGLNPSEQKDLSQNLMFELGRGQGNDFSSIRWLKSFENLPDSSRKMILSPFSKSHREKIETLRKVLPKIKETLDAENTSKTSHYLTAGGTGAQTLHAATNLLGGNILPAGALLAHAAFARMGASALTNPKVASWLVDSMKVKTEEAAKKRLTNLQKIKGIPLVVRNEAKRILADAFADVKRDDKGESHESDSNNGESSFLGHENNTLIQQAIESGDPELLALAKKLAS